MAIGNEEFVTKVKVELGIGAIHRDVQSSSEGHYLKEEQISYRPDFKGVKTAGLMEYFNNPPFLIL